MIALIDADSLLYKIGFGLEDAIDWDCDGNYSYYTDIEKQKTTLQQMIDSILFVTGCDDYELHLTSGKNFRDKVVDDYKHNRVDSRKPTGFHELKQYAVDELGAIINEGIEADDMVVYKRTNLDNYILCAIDKDVLYQTVGTHYNYGREEFITVNEWEALRFKYYQCIAGDPVDGYKGVPGYGPKKADKALEECKTERDLWLATLLCYRSKKMKRSQAIATMRLADMHQYNGKSVTLWTPPHKG